MSQKTIKYFRWFAHNSTNKAQILTRVEQVLSDYNRNLDTAI